MSEIKHRMSRATTVLALQGALGVVESISEFNFPDIRSRPTFRVGIMRHGLREALGTGSSALHKDDISAAKANHRFKQDCFTVGEYGIGGLGLGPYVQRTVGLPRANFVVSFLRQYHRESLEHV